MTEKRSDIVIMDESELIDDLRMKGYILKKADGEDATEIVHRAYRAGKDAGEVEMLLKMLQDVEHFAKGTGGALLYGGARMADFMRREIRWYIRQYLPERYKREKDDDSIGDSLAT